MTGRFCDGCIWDRGASCVRPDWVGDDIDVEDGVVTWCGEKQTRADALWCVKHHTGRAARESAKAFEWLTMLGEYVAHGGSGEA